jgi:hypothetical protein
MIPTASELPWVSCSTNQLSAILCIQDPDCEIAWPKKKSR